MFCIYLLTSLLIDIWQQVIVKSVIPLFISDLLVPVSFWKQFVFIGSFAFRSFDFAITMIGIVEILVVCERSLALGGGFVVTVAFLLLHESQHSAVSFAEVTHFDVGLGLGEGVPALVVSLQSPHFSHFGVATAAHNVLDWLAAQNSFLPFFLLVFSFLHDVSDFVEYFSHPVFVSLDYQLAVDINSDFFEFFLHRNQVFLELLFKSLK
mmetsp:Transcript_54866/g.119535  ORF Transcript_54866/g.119535 Transcript_54866/m.119535 type:complete len:209 (+) Transcript_54866:145-771(+)